MATLIFDFDSTIISVESLEWLIAAEVSDPMVQAELNRTTDLGMSGEIPFRQSLEQRLRLANFSLSDVVDSAGRLLDYLTDGVADLIARLHCQGHSVWILSGGLKEVILPVASKLGISSDCVGAVQLNWGCDGCLIGLDPDDAFSDSKVNGAKDLARSWQRPVVAIGDGMTDFDLYRTGMVEYFIAFAQHQRRESLMQVAPAVASSMAELERMLEALI